MTEYIVYIETKGDPVSPKEPVAHVPALPGATARGKTVEEAKKKIRDAIRDYLTVLHEAGESVPEPDAELTLKFEEVRGTTLLTDYDALHPNEMEALLRWLAISRQELMGLVKDLPQETLDWKSDTETPTINEILYHIAEADLWYTDRLKKWPESALFRLAAARGVALERLRALTEKEWAGMTTYDGQKWTPRKIIRRMLEHEREQIERIRALLAASEAD